MPMADDSSLEKVTFDNYTKQTNPSRNLMLTEEISEIKASMTPFCADLQLMNPLESNPVP